MLSKFALVFFFLLQPNVANTLGIAGQYLEYGRFFFGFLLLVMNIKKGHWLTCEGLICAAFIIMLIIRSRTGILSESVRYSMYLAIPVLFSQSVPDSIVKSKKNRIKLPFIKHIKSPKNNRAFDIYKFAFIIFLVYFAFQALLIIYEGIFHTHVFLWTDSVYGSNLNKIQLRPVALNGSPLANSHVMAIFAFYLLQTPLRLKYKLIGWGGCFLLLLLLQGRTAIVLSLLYLVVYLLFQARKGTIKLWKVIALTIVAALFVLILLFLGLGSRLFETEDGGSALMRIQAIDYMLNASLKDFMVGTSLFNLDRIVSEMGVTILEVAFLNQIILFGVIFTSVFLYLTYRKLYVDSFYGDKLLTLFTLLMIAVLTNTNIGWFSSTTVMVFAFLFAKILDPKKISHVIPSAYLLDKKEYEYV